MLGVACNTGKRPNWDGTVMRWEDESSVRRIQSIDNNLYSASSKSLLRGASMTAEVTGRSNRDDRRSDVETWFKRTHKSLRLNKEGTGNQYYHSLVFFPLTLGFIGFFHCPILDFSFYKVAMLLVTETSGEGSLWLTPLLGWIISSQKKVHDVLVLKRSLRVALQKRNPNIILFSMRHSLRLVKNIGGKPKYWGEKQNIWGKPKYWERGKGW